MSCADFVTTVEVYVSCNVLDIISEGHQCITRCLTAQNKTERYRKPWTFVSAVSRFRTRDPQCLIDLRLFVRLFDHCGWQC